LLSSPLLSLVLSYPVLFSFSFLSSFAHTAQLSSDQIKNGNIMGLGEDSCMERGDRGDRGELVTWVVRYDGIGGSG